MSAPDHCAEVQQPLLGLPVMARSGWLALTSQSTERLMQSLMQTVSLRTTMRATRGAVHRNRRDEGRRAGRGGGCTVAHAQSPRDAGSVLLTGLHDVAAWPLFHALNVPATAGAVTVRRN